MANPCLQPAASHFRGYPFIEYRYTRSQTFTRNNCGSGMQGSQVTYSKEYVSYISEEDLEAKVEADEANFMAQGQAHANSTGTCSITCQTRSAVPNGILLTAIDSSQIWLSQSDWVGGNNDNPFLPIPRSTVESTAPLPSRQMMTNWSGELFPFHWKTPWPHSSASIFYRVYKNINNGRLYLDTLQPSNPCVAPTSVQVAGDASASNRLIAGFLPISNSFFNGVLYVMSASSHAEIYWRDLNSNSDTFIGSIDRPVSDYILEYVPIVCTGSAIYFWLKWKNNHRGRGHIYRLTGPGTPVNLTTIHNFGYSTEDPKYHHGANIGSSAYFWWEEGGSLRSITFGGSNIATVPDNRIDNIMTDPTNSNIALAGASKLASNAIVLYRYNATNNSWTGIRT